MDQPQKIYVITPMEGQICSFLLRDGKAVEIHRDEKQKEPALGNIYVGKIKNIAKNIGAAFVEIAPGTTCHLALSDMKRPVYTKKGASSNPQAGDELLVQVSREGIKSKYPSVTTNLVFHGKYVLLTTGNTSISVSAKLSGEERKRLLAFYERRKDCRRGEPGQPPADPHTELEHPECGWLFRTNAGGVPEDILSGEMERLRGEYGELMAQAMYRTCFSCLFRMPQTYLKRLSDLYESEADQILTDDPEIYAEAREYLLKNQKEDLGKLSLYEDSLLPLKKLYSLEHQLDQARQEKVWMRSGGYLVIQPTEALTVIDVNTGKYEGGKQKEAAFLKINLEAAVEIARQIRLRNISGIIIVDFINMKEEDSRKQLMSLLDGELKKDPVPTVLVDMTKLSLVEITRKKKERPLS